MITGIQITKAANDDLLNSFWLQRSNNPIFLIPYRPSPASGSPASLSIRHKRMSLTRSALQSWVTLKW